MIRNGFKFTARKVKHRVAKDKNITSFSISDKVDNGVKHKYQYYEVTVWEDLDIKDDDVVVLTNIRDFTAREYNEKVYLGFTADAEIGHWNNEQPKAEEPKKKPRDTSTDLPWDI